MKLYTTYSESHAKIFEQWFVPSLKSTNPNIDLRYYVYEQVCPSARFMSNGWKQTMIIKNELIVYSLDKAEEGEIIIQSDADVQFFKDIEKNLDLDLFIDNDIVCQKDGDGSCGEPFCYGFMLIKNNSKTRAMFNYILEVMKTIEDHPRAITDQQLLNKIYKEFDVSIFGYDPSYFSICMSNHCRVWNGEELVNIPDNLILHHANWTVGVDNKIKLFDMVKRYQIC